MYLKYSPFTPYLTHPPAHCDGALGMQSGDIPDSSITASSHFDAAVSAVHAR